MKFAVFSVSIPEYAPDVAAAKIKEIGYDGIEWRVTDQDAGAGRPGFWAGNLATLPFSTFEQDAPAWRKMTEGAGLEMPALGTYVTCDDLDGVESAMRGATAMGVSQLRVRAPGNDGVKPFLPIWDAARGQYGDVVDLARKHGVRALLELHHGTIVPSASAARLFLGDLDPVHVGVIHDAGNMVHEGHESYRLGLEVLGPYLALVHLKNARWLPAETGPDGSTRWKADWAPLPHGIVDISALFIALGQVGYDGWVCFEDFSTEQPLVDRLRDNLAYVRTIVDGMGATS